MTLSKMSLERSGRTSFLRKKGGEKLWMGFPDAGFLGCFLVLKPEDAVNQMDAVFAVAMRKSWVSSALCEEARQVASLRSVTDSPLVWVRAERSTASTVQKKCRSVFAQQQAAFFPAASRWGTILKWQPMKTWLCCCRTWDSGCQAGIKL